MPRRLRPFMLLVLVLAGALPARGAGPAPVPQDLGVVPPAKGAELFRIAHAGDAASRLGVEKAPPSLDVLVLLCEFEDAVFYGREEDPAQVDPVFAEIVYAARDTLYYRHLMRDVKQYFDSASGGAFMFNATIHQQVVALPHTMGFYGNHTEHGEQPVVLARDVLEAVDPDVAFDGYDTILLIHAGAGEETDVNDDSAEQIYSTYLDPESFQEAFDEGVLTDGPWLAVDDGAVRVDQVLVLPETGYQDGIQWGSLGLYCFEVGQRLGMLSLGTGYRSWGIGSLGLMGWGLYAANGWNPPHPCAYNKLLMGWLDPPSVVPGTAPANLALTPALDPGSGTPAVRVEIGPDEFWLLEYRLQDPDGNERWNIDPVEGDLNGNGFRDFWDADAADGRPERDPATGALLEKFNPEEGDQREWLIGAEWDFHMTFNGQRPRSEDTGRGSGIYVWHVDEGVITASLAAGTRLVNWDPEHKGVDLEEADGIQDMDSMRSDIEYAFGHEDDVFEGPDAVFGPATAPRTDTAAGAPTGIQFENFGTVRRQDGSYVPEMAVTVWRTTPAAGPTLTAQRDLPAGTDLTGSHVLLADLDPAPGGTAEIVLTDRTGEIYVLDGALDDFVDDGDPGSLSPFAVGTYADTAVVWNPPAAAGDLDGDGAPEIVLTAANGLYAFTADGSPLREALAGAHGLHVELPSCTVPPVLLQPDPADGTVPETLLRVAVVVRDGASTRLRMYQGAEGDLVRDVDLGDVVVRAAPVLAFERLWVAAADTVGGDHRLLGIAASAAASPAVLDLPLGFEPGLWPVAWGLEAGTAEARGWIAVAGPDGRGATLWLDSQGAPDGFLRPWSPRLAAGGPLAAGALLADGVMGLVGPEGDWEDGWPRRPDPSFAAADPVSAPAPLTAALAGAVRAAQQHIFSLPDGRLFAFGPRGEAEEGWPLAGPGRCAGSPALGQVAGGASADLVAVGTFGRVTGIDHDTGELDTVERSVVAVWNDVAVPDGAWTMWGGGPSRSGVYDVAAAAPPLAGAAGSGIIEGSHICYPSPLTGATLYVRARLRGPGRVRAQIYDLEGERITVSPWRQVPAQSAFDLPVELGGVVSGMYLCRLEALPDDGERAFSVVPFAVSR